MARNYIKEHCLHFGLDYLVLYWTFKSEGIFNSLNTTNSHYWELWDLIYNKRQAGHQYQYCIDFNYQGYNIFSYVKGRKNISIPTNDAVTFYWAAFRLLEIEEIDYFIQSYFDVERMKRFDICMDIEDPIEKVWKKFRKPKQRWKIHLSKKWELEWRWIGEYNTSKNRRLFIRLYNKIQDIKESRKSKLYWDYLQKKYVTRVEIEFRRELARNIDYRELYNIETLKSLFKNYLRKHTDIFKSLSKDKITLYRKPKGLSDDEVQSIYYRQMFKSSFLGYARRILQIWWCPIRVLIWEWIFLDSTKEKIGKDIFEDIRIREDILKNKTYSPERPWNSNKRGRYE